MDVVCMIVDHASLAPTLYLSCAHIDVLPGRSMIVASRRLSMYNGEAVDMLKSTNARAFCDIPDLDEHFPLELVRACNYIVSRTNRTRRMAGRQNYDAVVDIDDEADLGQTDLEFHKSTFETNGARGAKVTNEQASFLQPDTRVRKEGRHIWTISFWQQYFDVDTEQILRRCWAALYPRTNFLDVLENNPDLYGPFWIATTVVVILFLTGTISQYIASEGGSLTYRFELFSAAAGLVYGYTLVIPAALWAVLRWYGSQSADLLECWNLYGYANIVWIPIAIISWSQITVLNYVFVAVGYALSIIFLTRNLYPVITAIDAKTSRILLIAVILLHAGFAIAIRLTVFSHDTPIAAPSTPTPTPETPPSGGEEGRLF